jgi:hypothetical protein
VRLRRRPKWLPVEIELPRGRYVYAWYKNGEQFPFYVGKGTCGRAWAPHLTGKKLAACERMRQTAQDFKVEIIRDDLSAAETKLVESVLIDFLVARGVLLWNSPQRRRTPPKSNCADSSAVIQDSFNGWSALAKVATMSEPKQGTDAGSKDNAPIHATLPRGLSLQKQE